MTIYDIISLYMTIYDYLYLSMTLYDYVLSYTFTKHNENRSFELRLRRAFTKSRGIPKVIQDRLVAFLGPKMPGTIDHHRTGLETHRKPIFGIRNP